MNCKLKTALDNCLLLYCKERCVCHFIKCLERTIIVELRISEIIRPFRLLIRSAKEINESEQMLVAFIINVKVLHKHIHALLSTTLTSNMEINAMRLSLLLPVIIWVDLSREVDDFIGA